MVVGMSPPAANRLRSSAEAFPPWPSRSPLGVFRRILYTLRSLTYNSDAVGDFNYVVDTVLNPVLLPLNNLTKTLGPYLVAMVGVLLGSVVAICYVLGIEWYLRHERHGALAVAFVVGHFLQFTVWWHFYKGVTVNPGHPTSTCLLTNSAGVCRRCMFPRPVRAHHCSVCRRCVLRMDHHCPWLNNCVGLHTHRHFYLFCGATLAGCLFIAAFGLPVLYEHLTTEKNEAYFRSKPASYLGTWPASRMYSYLVWYTFFIVLAVGLCVFSLFYWHTRLILANETSIEQLLNSAERRRLKAMGQTYRNPFDRGRLANLKEVLLDEGQQSLWNAVLPWIEVDHWLALIQPGANRHKEKAHYISNKMV